VGFPRACVPCPHAERRTHGAEGAAAIHRASSNDNEFLPCVHRQRAEGLFPAMFQNQSDGLTQIRQAFFTRFALTIGAGNLRAIRDVPRAILLDNRRELVAHASFYRRHTRASRVPACSHALIASASRCVCLSLFCCLFPLGLPCSESETPGEFTTELPTLVSLGFRMANRRRR
jgi:hypothetical protein